MGRDALEPGEVGEPWFEYYFKHVPIVGPGGMEIRKRRRLPGDVRPSAAQVDWVTARVRHRLPNGSYREISYSGPTKGKAMRGLAAKVAGRSVEGTSTDIRATWTIEELATYWLARRQRTGLARSEGDLRPSSYRQISNTVRITVLGDRKARVHGEWRLVRRDGGIPELRIYECTAARLQRWLAELEQQGLSTRQTRSVLTQMFHLAVRDGALVANPMSSVEPTKRRPKATKRLNIEQARQLRELVTPDATRKPGARRTANTDLAEIIDFCLGTGCRIGEVLAVRWMDLQLDGEIPYVVIRGTMIEPRHGMSYERYPARKNDDRDRDMAALTAAREAGDARDLTLFRPPHLVNVLNERRHRPLIRRALIPDEEPIFASARGHYLWANNIRARLRTATAGTNLAGVKPHAIRKLVSTVIERELGMESARHQMGHADASLTGQVYVEDSLMGPDARDVLQIFFVAELASELRRIRPRPSMIRHPHHAAE